MKRPLSLPCLINQHNRAVMMVLLGLLFFFGYSIPNHFHLFTPQQLPLTELDRAVPFTPWTIFVYVSEYFLFISAYWLFKEDRTRNRYAWAYFGVLLVGIVVFVLFPTTYPREDYPLPSEMADSTTYRVFMWLRSMDDPSNCFPSMHVCCCYVTAFCFLDPSESRKRFVFYFTWASLVALSTLPTKQHYVADVIGGLLLAVIGYWFFFKKVSYMPARAYMRRWRNSAYRD